MLIHRVRMCIIMMYVKGKPQELRVKLFLLVLPSREQAWLWEAHPLGHRPVFFLRSFGINRDCCNGSSAIACALQTVGLAWFCASYELTIVSEL